MKKIQLSLISLLFISEIFAQTAIEKELSELRQISMDILKRIERLEKQQNLKSSESEVKEDKFSLDVISTKNVSHTHKGMVELSSNDTVLTLGGRIELDAYITNPDSSFTAAYKTASDGENKQFGAKARDSRLWLKTTTDTKLGILRSLIEVDFYSGSGNELNTNSHAPRLRHAYMTLNGFTAGQTFSFFTTVNAPDLIIDPVNETYARQPLIGWGNGNQELKYDFSLELPETTLIGTNGIKITPQDDQLPDIVARIRYYPDWGEVASSLILRQIRQDHASIFTNEDSEIGWGFNTSAKIVLFNTDDIRLGFQYGNALGRYFSEGAYSAGSVDTQGNIKLNTSYGGSFAYRHWWSEELRSTLAFAMVKTDNNMEVVPTTVSKGAYSNHVNLMWLPIKKGLIGLEYSHLLRENEQNDEATIDKLQMRFRYDF